MIGNILFWFFVVGCITFASGLSWWVVQEAVSINVSAAGIAMVVGALMAMWAIVIGMLVR
jgi:hypothetical protein